MHRPVKRAISATIGVLVCSLAWAGAASAGMVTMAVCANSAVPLNTSATGWTSSATQPPFSAVDGCQGGGRMQISVPRSQQVQIGLQGQWATTLPPGMALSAMNVPAGAGLINPNTQNAQGGGGFNVRYLWQGGATEVPVGSVCCGGLHYAGATAQAIGGRYFIIQVACNNDPGQPSGDCIYGPTDSPQVFDIRDFTLTAQDNTPPAVSTPSQAGTGANLWSAGPWVRGAFTLAFGASNPNGSGVCATAAYLDGAPLPGGSSSPVTNTQWQQCAGSLGFSDGIDTGSLSDGEHSLALDSIDAASPANHSPQTRTIGLDNLGPTITLPGAQDVPGNGSTTYLTATASAGPSGVRDIACSLDSAPPVSYPDATAQPTFAAQIPVAGLGVHQVSCTAQNNAVNSAGAVATSTTATATVALREPTSATATFAKLVDKAHCRTMIRRRHGKRMRARTCALRTIRKRETVIVKRHGKRVKVHRIVRVVVPPHVVLRANERVRYGHSTTVSGVLGSGGGALAGAPVSVLAAPNNGTGAYTQVATATTRTAGTWTAKIPPGPSRLIKAVYAGSASTEPAASTPITLSVPARIRIASIRPRHVPWGSKITITGRLSGGYLPPGGALVELRYSYGHANTVYGVKTHVTTPRFTTSFTFGPGQTPVTFGFQLATLPSGDFAYAPSSSNTIDVHVGGHPSTASRRRRNAHGHGGRHYKRKHR